MGNSIRISALDIDLLYPEIHSPQDPERRLRLRELAKRFRYADVAPGKLPPGPVSVRRLLARTQGNDIRRLELLSYNTWLMRTNFQVADILKGAVGAYRAVYCLILEFDLSLVRIVSSALERFGAGLSEVCDRIFPPVFSVCGVSLNPLNDACKVVAGIAEAAAKILELAGMAVDAVVDILLDVVTVPWEILIDVVYGLLSETLGRLLPDAPLIEKPDLDQRLPEIARELGRYDIVALAEVWRPEFRDALLSANRGRTALIGPSDPSPADWEHLGSGLLVFSPSCPIGDGGAHAFQTTGVHREIAGGCDLGALVDSDKLSRKGIQLTLVDVGGGIVELYSTHLYSGGAMPEILTAIVKGPTPEEMQGVRSAQVAELRQFVADTHVETNVAIICGDFNIGPNEYETLKSALVDPPIATRDDVISFDDWYAVTYKHADPDDHGRTNRNDDEKGGSVSTFDSHCTRYDAHLDRQRPRCGHDDYYCEEVAPAGEGAVGERIDYIFVQRPTLGHGFNLDVSRVRRRAFHRPEPVNGTQLFMSDHVGLEVTLFVSPR